MVYWYVILYFYKYLLCELCEVIKSVNWLTIIIHYFPKIVTFSKDYYMIKYGVCVSEFNGII